MALKLDILANTRSLVSEMKKGGASVDDVSDALDDMAREGSDAGEKLERSFREVAKSAEKADKQVQAVGKDGFGAAGQASTEFKNEALSNLSEVSSSFDGSISSIGDLAQGTLGGLAASIPGIGLLAAGAAAGVGLITSELVTQAEQAELLRERLSSAYLEASEEGRNYINTAQIVAEANDLMFNTERAAEWKQLQEDAGRLGLDNSVLIAANAGEQASQAEVQERINALLETTKSQYNDQDSIVGNVGQSVLGLQNRWQEVVDVTEEQKTKVRELEAVQAQTEARNREQIDNTARVAGERYEGLARQYGKLSVKLDVDDTDLRNYRPPTVTVPTKLGNPNIAGGLQLLG